MRAEFEHREGSVVFVYSSPVLEVIGDVLDQGPIAEKIRDNAIEQAIQLAKETDPDSEIGTQLAVWGTRAGSPHRSLVPHLVAQE